MDGGEKGVFASFFGRSENREFVGKMRFGGILKHEQQVTACCQTRSDYGSPKISLKLAV